MGRPFSLAHVWSSSKTLASVDRAEGCSHPVLGDAEEALAFLCQNIHHNRARQANCSPAVGGLVENKEGTFPRQKA